jgi:hypothetical protein
LEDVCYWRLRIIPGDCEERLVPAAVGARFFVAEDEVVEQVGWVWLLIVWDGL